jgi:Flp pilus assembly protein CpaB
VNASISRFTPVLLAGLAVLATACSATGSATSTSTVTATATATATVSPAPAKPNGAPLCATTQLTLRIGGGLVSDGADIYYIYFKNTAAAACTLRGYPGVSAVTGPDGSASQIGSDAKRASTSPVASQLLKPGRSVQATLRFARTGNFVLPQCQHVNVLFLKIFPPGGATAAYAGIDEQVCAETTLPTMTITTVIPDP